MHRSTRKKVSITSFLSETASCPSWASIGAKPVWLQPEFSVDSTAPKTYGGLFDASENSDAYSSSSNLSTDEMSDESSVSVSDRAAFFENRSAPRSPRETLPKKSRKSCRASTGATYLPPQPTKQLKETQMDNLSDRSMDLSDLISTLEQKLDGDSQDFPGCQPDIQRPSQRCMRRSSISRGSGVELELARRRSMIPASIRRDDSSSSDDESVDLRSTLEYYGSNRSFRRNSMAEGTSSSSLLLGNPESQNVIETMAVSLTLDSGYQSSFANRRDSMYQENLESDIPPEICFGQAGDSMKTEFNQTKVNSLRPSMKRGSSFGLEDDDAAERQRLGYEDMDAEVVQKTKVNSLCPSMKRGSSFCDDGDSSTERQRLQYEDMDAGTLKDTRHASDRTSEDHNDDQILLRLEDICGPESICRESLMSDPKVYARISEDTKQSKSSRKKSKEESKQFGTAKKPKRKVSPGELFGVFQLAMKASLDRQTSKQAKKKRKKLIKEIMTVMQAYATRRKQRARKRAHRERGGILLKPKASRRRSIACTAKVELECSQTTSQPPMSPVTNEDIGKYCKKELRAFLAKQQQKTEQSKVRKEALKTTPRRRRRASVV